MENSEFHRQFMYLMDRFEDHFKKHKWLMTEPQSVLRDVALTHCMTVMACTNQAVRSLIDGHALFTSPKFPVRMTGCLKHRTTTTSPPT